MRIAKARLALVQAKIAAPAKLVVVARLDETQRVARERALATACQQECRASKKADKAPHAVVTDPGVDHVDETEEGPGDRHF